MSDHQPDDVTDEQWEAVRAELGAGEGEPPTKEERARLVNLCRRDVRTADPHYPRTHE